MLEFSQPTPVSDTVSRRRYERAIKARQEAEALLDAKSRELWDANQKLIEQAKSLEELVAERTAELEAAMFQSDAANKAKSIFLANMSHEIRTPLNGVLGTAEAFLETSMDTEQKEMIDTIVASGQLLLSVLNDILDLSKIEAGQLEVEVAPFRPDEIFASIEQLYAMKAVEKNLKLAVELSPETKRWVAGDAHRLRQVAGNLVSNAIKFTRAGGVDVRVHLMPVDCGNLQLQLEVRDTGEGIPKDKLDRLFKPFSQVDSSVARRHGGTGLGLSITKQICELMGGAVSVETTEGKGSVFRASILLQPAEPPISQAGGVREVDSVLTSQRWRLLLAEDNRTNQLVIQKLLKSCNLDISVVNNGKQAVEALSAGEFDIILMDINMPEMDGIEATRLIRAQEESAGKKPTPIVALTANTMKHQVEEYLASGFDRHLGKPIKKNDLIASLQELLAETASERADQ